MSEKAVENREEDILRDGCAGAAASLQTTLTRNGSTVGQQAESAAMARVLFGSAWAFVLGVDSYDIFFAWKYRVVFEAWEINPLARGVARLYGFGAIFALKLGTTAFAVGLAVYCYHCRHRLTLAYTACVGGIHLLLSLHYLLSYFLGR
jgi:hypothetical protein